MSAHPTEADATPISRHDTLVMLMGEEDSGHSDFINVITGRPRLYNHHQSKIETIRVPGQDRLVLVDTPPLTGSVAEFLDDILLGWLDDDPPPELDIIGEWLKTMEIFGIRLTGIIYMLSVHSSESRVNPSILLDAFQRVASNVILVVNTKDVDLKSAMWIEKEIEIEERFSRLRPLDLPLYQCFDNLASALKITSLFMQDNRVDVRLVLDKAGRGFTLACVKDRWWFIKRRVVRNAIYEIRQYPILIPPGTLQGTHDNIMDWILRRAPGDAHIMWLYGRAGSGKSTLAWIIAESCRAQNLLLASFFFSRRDPARNTIDPLIPTIVYQIGNASRTIKETITDAMEDESLPWAPFAMQLNQLVLQPLLEHDIPDFPSLIIIHGLDECIHSSMQSELVEAIARSRQNFNGLEYPLRFLIFSKPDNHLKKAFKSLVPASMLHCMALNDRRWPKFANFSASRAIHSSKERHDPPKCHPNTRVAIRERLLDWATRKTSGVSPILWFYGAAGTGKSAIAQTLAETLQSQNFLIATFFFSRTDPTRNTIKPLATTMAYQIGTIVPDLQESILEALDYNPRLLNESFDSQLNHFVLQPLAELAKESSDLHVPPLFVIDGLDECFDSEIQSQIVITLAEATKNEKCPIRIVIVSRPEQHLEHTFNTRVPSSVVDRLSLDGSCVTDDDIQTFLQGQLGAMRQSHPRLNQNWPGSTAIERLGKRSLGQFVYVSTIVKYISSSEDPSTCLDKILNLRCKPEDEGLLSSELDILYLHILSSVKEVEVIKMILGIILFVDPHYDFFASLVSAQPSAAQTLSGIAMLVGLSPAQTMAYISQLHPMIQHSNDGSVFVSHASVAEFLNDFNRSKSFYLDRRYILTKLIGRCFQIIKNGGDDMSTQYAYGRLPQLCIGIPRTSSFVSNLMEFRLAKCHRWCQLNAHHVGAALTEEDRNLFPRWYVTRFLMILRQLEQPDAYSHQLSAFDELIRSTLSRYRFEDFQLMLSIMHISMPSMNLTSKRIFMLLRGLEVKEATLTLDASMGGLGLLSIYPRDGRSDDDCFRIGQHRSRDIVVDAYHQHLSDFFNDPARSGEYSLSPLVFEATALRFRKFIYEVQVEVDIDIIGIAHSFLPRLLGLAGKSVDVLSFLQNPE